MALQYCIISAGLTEMFKDDKKKLHYSSRVTEQFESTCETHMPLIFEQFTLGIDFGSQPSLTYVSTLN